MFTDIFSRFVFLELFLMEYVSMICPNFHLQTQYCISEIAFVAQRPDQVNTQGPYKMKIITVFKGNNALRSISKGSMVNVKTNVDFKNLTQGALSQPQLAVFGQIKDGNVYSGQCIRFYPFTWMNTYQKTALTEDYKSGCDCIKEITKEYRDFRCNYEYSFLVRKNGKCVWHNNKSLQKCEEYQKWLTTMMKQ